MNERSVRVLLTPDGKLTTLQAGDVLVWKCGPQTISVERPSLRTADMAYHRLRWTHPQERLIPEEEMKLPLTSKRAAEKNEQYFLLFLSAITGLSFREHGVSSADGSTRRYLAEALPPEDIRIGQ